MVDFKGMTPPCFLHAARKAVNRAKSDPTRGKKILRTLVDWVDDNPIKFSPTSAMGRLVDLIMKFDNDEKVDHGDTKAFMIIIGDFFHAISSKDIADIQMWNLETNFKINQLPHLLVLFGKPRPIEGIAWAQSKFEIGNRCTGMSTDKDSFKEVPRISRCYSADFASDVKNQGSENNEDKDLTELKLERDDDRDRDRDRVRNRVSELKLERDDDSKEEEESDFQDDGDDQDDEDNEDNDYIEGYERPAVGMEEIDCDWKPPQTTGIEANPDSYKM